MGKNQKRKSGLARRKGNQTESKLSALTRPVGRVSFEPMPRLVVARQRGGVATVELFDTQGRCGIAGTNLTFTDPDDAMEFLGIV